MIRPYLVEIASKGGWVGVCPNLCPIVGFWQPMTGAELHPLPDERIRGQEVLGPDRLCRPSIRYCRFNTEAAAEWTWNAKGRSPQSSPLSWAVREGLRDPEKFAEWSETIGSSVVGRVRFGMAVG